MILIGPVGGVRAGPPFRGRRFPRRARWRPRCAERLRPLWRTSQTASGSSSCCATSRALEIDEYADEHHRATVPHTVVLEPGSRRIAKVYVGYWYWGRPSASQLWVDLQEVFRGTKADFDPTTP